MVEWMDQDSFRKRSMRKYIASTLGRCLLISLALTWLLMEVDIYLGTFIHYFPEFVFSFLLGYTLYTIGFRVAFYLLFSITSVWLVIYVVSLYGVLPAVPIVLGFLVTYMAGYHYARKTKGVRKLGGRN